MKVLQYIRGTVVWKNENFYEHGKEKRVDGDAQKVHYGKKKPVFFFQGIGSRLCNCKDSPELKDADQHKCDEGAYKVRCLLDVYVSVLRKPDDPEKFTPDVVEKWRVNINFCRKHKKP